MRAPDENRTISFAQEASLGLPGSIKQVADFLLSEGTGIAPLTMAQIAARSYTSKPTLVRFAKQAGYAGWKDYRHDFLVAMAQQEAHDAQQADVDVNFPFAAGAAGKEIVTSLLRIQSLAGREVEHSLDHTTLEQAATALLTARTVLCLGVMQNLHRNKIFASNLSLIGVLCHQPEPHEAAPMARWLTEGDCVVVTSYAGGIEHMPVALVPQLKERGVKVIAVTNAERSPLGDLADYCLSFRPREHYHAKVAAFYSGTCTSLILDALFACCYAQRFEESRASRERLISDIDPYLPKDFTHMK